MKVRIWAVTLAAAAMSASLLPTTAARRLGEEPRLDDTRSSMAVQLYHPPKASLGQDQTHNLLRHHRSLVNHCRDEIATWMSCNFETLRGKKLYEISMPGSHDAGMYTARSCSTVDLGPAGDIGPEECSTVTQKYDIAEQLLLGARYFDVRPMIYRGELVIGHYSWVEEALGIKIQRMMGCVGGTLAEILKDVATFAEGNPRELVILSLSHYYDRGKDGRGRFDTNNFEMLHALVEKTLEPYLVKRNSLNSDLLDMTYEEILEQGNVIALFKPVDNTDHLEYLDHDELPIYDKYSKTDSVNKMMNDQFSKLREYGGNPEQLFLLSWTLTLSETDSVKCGTFLGGGESIKSLAQEANERFSEILRRKDGGNLPNIVYTDFIDGQSTKFTLMKSGLSSAGHFDLDLKIDDMQHYGTKDDVCLKTFGDCGPDEASDHEHNGRRYCLRDTVCPIQGLDTGAAHVKIELPNSDDASTFLLWHSGEDAMFIDVAYFVSPGSKIQWGRNGGKGWSLSTDPKDTFKRSRMWPFPDEVYAKESYRMVLFDIEASRWTACKTGGGCIEDAIFDCNWDYKGDCKEYELATSFPVVEDASGSRPSSEMKDGD
mmetsp:Transcript_2562/g.5414  ORF Transcript_2562/g.5414 Transcript_2562/m.5414 type:complete len:600 (+) Transcript_2562:199-1998(+)